MPYVVTSPSRRGHRRAGRTDHHLAGLQPVGRLQPLRRAGRRLPQPRGQLRPPLQRRDRGQRLPHGGDPDRRARRADRHRRCPTSPTSTSHTRPDALDGARGYVSMGHDEYWTTAMREAVLDARDAGTNLAFLGANTMYWRVRLETGRPARRGWWSATAHDAHLDPLYAQGSPDATAPFRDATGPAARARPARHAVRVLPGRHRLRRSPAPAGGGSAAPGVRRGDHVAGLVGPEADRVYPDAPAARGRCRS